MVQFGYYNINNSNISPAINFQGEQNVAPLTKPIETMEQSIETAVDDFVKKVDEEKEKKSNKKAIAVGSSVIVLSALIAVLNPRISSKIINKVSIWRQELTSKLQNPKNNSFAKKFYNACVKGLDVGMRGFQFTNNFNSAKDIGFKWLCTKEKNFNGLKPGKFKNFIQNADKHFVAVMTKVHNSITKGFDYISMKTVLRKYRKSNNTLDKFEKYVLQNIDKCTPQEKQKIMKKLEEAKRLKQYFSEKSVTERLTNQKDLMADLETEFIEKLKIYKDNLKNGSNNRTEYIDKNLSFWAEDIMKPTRDKIEKDGISAISKLVNNSSSAPGVYNQIFDILSTKLSYAETIPLEKTLLKCHTKLNKANNYEYVKYFDKKRDLVLGSAPTDILSALIGLGASGIAIGTADNKEERISRALTGGFPIVAGLGASMAFTAMLLSGVKSMVYGTLASVALSKTGSIVNHQLIEKPNNNKKA